MGYQQASVATETIAAVLNGGQGFVLAAGLTAVLASATLSTAVGSFTGGDLVMAQGLLLQLWGPLQFLGWFYRELRQSLVRSKLSDIIHCITLSFSSDPQMIRPIK